MFKAFREDINAVFQRDPAVRSTLEVVICYPGFHALQFHRVAHKLWQLKWFFIARFVSQFSRFLTGIEIHPGAKIGRGFFIDHGMGVVIGETAEIGDNCTLYHGVTLGGTSWAKEKRHPTLGNDVIIGSGAKILGPFKVGNGSKIGSNSVVVKEVPDQATVVGVPGRMVLSGEEREEQIKQQRFDLEHGSLPDPQAQAISCLFEHIRKMELQLDQLQQEQKKLQHQLQVAQTGANNKGS
ncbi:MAG: serine O-acetyltransferase [Thermodesulfobacteriota bacterium]|nr:serine O-acetyltransferase [Thermodesulfobacteriota bacterium]